jgi:adenylate cyclase class 2
MFDSGFMNLFVSEDRSPTRECCARLGIAPGKMIRLLGYTIGSRRRDKAGSLETRNMARETEIKLKIGDVRAFHRVLKKIGARVAGLGSGRVHEENVIFDTPQGGLAKHGQLLRIRTETPEARNKAKQSKAKPRVVVTFKRPPAEPPVGEAQLASRGRYKVREEIEAEVADAGALTKIFEGLGMAGWFRYEKYRTTYQLPASKAWARGLLIELDETPIGTYVELEGPPQAIDRVAEELGYSKQDYVLKNYLVLYVEDCRRKGEQPRHMLFPDKKKPSK